jgi:hypothetical protein
VALMLIHIEPEDRPLFAVHALHNIADTVHEVATVIARMDDEDDWPEEAARDIEFLHKTLDLLEVLERAVIAAREPECVP